MPTLTNRVAITLILSSAIGAHAQGYSEEWRVMGPAFSYHGDKDQARKVTDVSSSSCVFGGYALPAGETLADGSKYGIPATTCSQSEFGTNHDTSTHTEACTEKQWGSLTRANPYDGKTYPWTFNVCSTSDSSTSKKWHQNNPALGGMYTRRYDDHSTSFFATVVRDSYGEPSLMTGGAYMWPLADVGSVHVDGGFAGGLWYRSILNTDTNQLKRTVIPYALPGLSVTETHTGIGFELGIEPKMSASYRGRQFATPMVVMVQLTWLVKKTDASTQQVGLQQTPDGGVQASYAQSF
jgi:hypothetical protein